MKYNSLIGPVLYVANMCTVQSSDLLTNSSALPTIKQKPFSDDPENSLEVKEISNYITSDNISVYVDVWCSLNKRFQQRMYDPNYDLLRANWSPFESVEWLMPVLMEYSGFRTTMNDISREVYSWSNNSDVLFIADFPGNANPTKNDLMFPLLLFQVCIWKTSSTTTCKT